MLFRTDKGIVPIRVMFPPLINEFIKQALSSEKEYKSLLRGFSVVLAPVNNEAASGGHL